jgi:hypothetical protein
MQLMPALSRGLAASLVCFLLVLGSTTAARAAVQEIPRIPPAVGALLGDQDAQIVWDAALKNRFGWRFAQGRIPTACNDVRAGFPTRVAMMRCALDDQFVRGRAVQRTWAFSGAGGGGGGSEGGGSGGGILDPRLIRPAPSAEVVPTPLPAGVLLLASALGGLVVARWATRRSENARAATFAT